MMKRIAVAAGIAALLGTSAAALAGSSITLYSTPVELKPVAVDGQWSVGDGERVGGATGIQGVLGTTSTTTVTPTAGSTSVDIGTAARVEQQVSDGGCSTDCGLVDEPTEQSAAEDAYRAQASDQASDAEPMMEDDPGWDCHTMGNRVCGPGHE